MRSRSFSVAPAIEHRPRCDRRHGHGLRTHRLQPSPSKPDCGKWWKCWHRRSSAAEAGQGGEDGAYLTEQFRRLKLEGLFGGEYLQAIPGKEPGTRIGQNVGAMLRGSDPKLRDQWVILAAHFDHLGVRGGKLFPGADDNASGVAMMLEVARCVVQAPTPPKRSIMFIGFDLEEIGLFGSRYFVAHPPVPLDRVALFVTADMIGRALAGVCEEHVFVLGTEHSPGLRPWIEEAGRGRPLSIGLLGSDLLVLNRSDYGPFRSREHPLPLLHDRGESPLSHPPGHRRYARLSQDDRHRRGDPPGRSQSLGCSRTCPAGSPYPITRWPRR